MNKGKIKNQLKDMMSNASSVVNKRFKSSKQFSISMIALLSIVFIVLAFGLHHHHKKQKQARDRYSQVHRASLALQDNLKRLQALQKEKNQPMVQNISEQASGSQGTNRVSKAYIARMNAPTSVYEASHDYLQVNRVDSLNDTPGAKGSVANKSMNTFIGGDKNSQFANQSPDEATMIAHKIKHPDFTIASGEFLHAVLNVASNSDLPGMVSAVISDPAYSYTGEHALIPAGSRLLGQYSSSVLQGQDRIFIIWHRLLLPNGVTVDIDSPGADAIGQAGMTADYVNRHFFARFGEASLLSILGAGVSTYGVSGDDEYNSAAQYRIAIANSLQDSAQQSMQNSVAIKPTLKAYQGAKINVFIAHDLDFYGQTTS